MLSQIYRFTDKTRRYDDNAIHYIFSTIPVVFVPHTLVQQQCKDISSDRQKNSIYYIQITGFIFSPDYIKETSLRSAELL